MSNFTSVTQRVTSANPGDSLTGIVDFTAAIQFGVIPVVQLRDLATGKLVCSITYGFTVGEVVSGSLPSATYGSNPTSLTMGQQPMYLQLELALVGIGGSVTIADKRVLQPINPPGSGGGGGAGGLTPDQVPVAVGLGAVAVLSFAGIAYMRHQRGKRRR